MAERGQQIDTALRNLRRNFDQNNTTSVVCKSCHATIYCASKFVLGDLNAQIEEKCMGIDTSGNPVAGVACELQDLDSSSS